MLGVPTPSFPSLSSQQRQNVGSSGKKVALRPGRSLMDWIKLTKGNEDVQGFMGRMHAVTLDELASHKTVDDCWMAIRGQVYNVTRYMEYHPGGVDELMKGAGKDATEIFEAVHKWVNYSSMLAKCLIGPLKYEVKTSRVSKTPVKSDYKFLVPKPPMVVKDAIPRYEWYEKPGQVVISIYIKQFFDSSQLLLDCEDGRILDLKIMWSVKFYWVRLELPHPVSDAAVNAVTSKKVEIVLSKEDSQVKWTTLGKELSGHNTLTPNTDRELKFRNCNILRIQNVTHDTKLYSIEIPSKCYFECPVGHHVKLEGDVDGVQVVRSYTVALSSLHPQDDDEKKGKVIHLMIKHYCNGTLTPTLRSLEEGSVVRMSESVGSFDKYVKKDVSEVFLICAGTGFTPMIRLLVYYLHRADCSSRVKLLFANKQERDILWKDKIDEKVAEFPSRFHCTYILSEPDSSWPGARGKIDESLLKTFIHSQPFTNVGVSHVTTVPMVDTGRFFAICGPDHFTLSMKNILSTNIRVNHSSIHCFMD